MHVRAAGPQAFERFGDARRLSRSRPLAASTGKRVFHAVYLIIAAFFAYRAYLSYAGQQRNGAFLASAARFTALEARGGGPGTAAGVGGFGLLSDGCPVAGGRRPNATHGVVTVDFARPVQANGYYFVTSDGDPALDPVRWLVEVSAGGGASESWTAVGAGVWEMTSAGTAFPFPGLAYPTPTARGQTVGVDQGYTWPLSLQNSIGGPEWAVGLVCCVALWRWNRGGATRPIFLACTLVDLLSVPFAAVGFRVLGDWRNEAQAWLLLCPQTVLFLGILLFEARIVWVFALYAASIFATSVIIVSVLYGSTLATALLDGLSPGPATGCVLLDLVVVAFRWRALRRARRLVEVDEERYTHAWALVQQGPDAPSWISDLRDLAAVLSARCQGGAPRQLVRLPPPAAGAPAAEARGPSRWPAAPSDERGAADGAAVRSLDQLYVQALCLNPILRRKVQAWAAASAGNHVVLRTESAWSPDPPMVQVRFAAIKSVSRAVEKSVRSYAQVRGASPCPPRPARSAQPGRPSQLTSAAASVFVHAGRVAAGGRLPAVHRFPKGAGPGPLPRCHWQRSGCGADARQEPARPALRRQGVGGLPRRAGEPARRDGRDCPPVRRRARVRGAAAPAPLRHDQGASASRRPRVDAAAGGGGWPVGRRD